MNYRHAYHAGNHGDVLKHIVLARVIEHMKQKDKGFLYLDAHAGLGAYELTGPEAGKTREWEAGVGKVWTALQNEPWARAVALLNPGGGHMRYPGSPEIARALLRAQDRLVLNELHPEDHAVLAAQFARDRRVTVTRFDAGVVVKAHLPPSERRGVILIDPPYENADETGIVLDMLRQGLRRFATGTFIVWYPVVDDDLAARLQAGIGPALRAELRLRPIQPQGGLIGSGLLIVNPPWTLETELRGLLPRLADLLGAGPDAEITVES